MNCISHLSSPLYACTQAQMHTCVHACAHTQTPWDLSILLPSESHASFYCVFVPLVHLWSSAEKLFWILFAFLHFDHFFPFVIFLSFFFVKKLQFFELKCSQNHNNSDVRYFVHTKMHEIELTFVFVMCFLFVFIF